MEPRSLLVSLFWRWQLPGLAFLACCFQAALQLCISALLFFTGLLAPAGPAPSSTAKRRRPSSRGARPACGRPGALGPSSPSAARSSGPTRCMAQAPLPSRSGHPPRADCGCLPAPALPRPVGPAATISERKEAAGASSEGRSNYPEGYNAQVEGLRVADFVRLGEKVYADYAGAPPYADSLLRSATEDLLSSLHGNPHSAYGWAQHASEAAAERLRQLTLAMCCADPQDYECVLTSGATGALKLVGESFPWGPHSAFLHLRDNHNSVLGLRQLAAQRGASSAAVQVAAYTPGAATSAPATGRQGAPPPRPVLTLCVCGSGAASSRLAAVGGQLQAQEGEETEGREGEEEAQHLFAMPLESNLWGVRYEEGLVGAVQQRRFAVETAHGEVPPPPGRWRVLLDAAKGCASRPPDLSRHPADYVALSYYKIFGYPTGVGALIVRRDALDVLLASKAYFGGGTVAVSLAEDGFFRRRAGAAGLEDGTLPFLQLPAVLHGFAFIQRWGGFEAVGAHAGAVARFLVELLQCARHANGAPLCVVYGAWPGAVGLLPEGGGLGGAEAGSAGGHPRSGAGEGLAVGRGDGAEAGHAQHSTVAVTQQQEAQQEARQEAQRLAAKQLGGPEAVHRAIACHKALQRTQVLRHRHRRSRGIVAEGGGGNPGVREAAGAHTEAVSSGWLPSKPSRAVSTPESLLSDESLCESWEDSSSLRHHSMGSGGGGPARAQSAGTETTLYFSPRSSLSGSTSAGSSITFGSTVGAATSAAEGAAGAAEAEDIPALDFQLGGPDGGAAGEVGSAPGAAREQWRVEGSCRASCSAFGAGASDATCAACSAGAPHELPKGFSRSREGGAEHVGGIGDACSSSSSGNQGECGVSEACCLLRRCGVTGQGPVVAFNVLRADGSFVGYREVEKLGSLHGIFLRTGCMCNPGVCALALGLTPLEMRANYEAGHVCWDDHDVIHGRPTGVVRASFGYASTLDDARAIAELLERYFVEKEGEPGGQHTRAPSSADDSAAAGLPSGRPPTVPSPVPATLPVQQLHASCDQAAPHLLLQRMPPPPPPPSHPTAVSAAAAGFERRTATVATAATVGSTPFLPAWPEVATRLSPAAPQPAMQRSSTRRLEAAPGAPDSACSMQPLLPAGAAGEWVGGGECVQVEGIYVYPIKSCRGMSAEAWPLGPTGLLYDRHWVLVDGSNAALTLRKCPALAIIQPCIDLERGVLHIAADGMADTLEVPLPASLPRSGPGGGEQSGGHGTRGVGTAAAEAAGSRSAPRTGSSAGDSGVDGSSGGAVSIRVCSRAECGQRVAAASGDAAVVGAWFERALGVPCRLVQQLSGGGGGGRGPDPDAAWRGASGGAAAGFAQQGGAEQTPVPAPGPPCSFANEAQLLVVSSASLADLHARSAGAGAAVSAACQLSASLAAFARRFRPNLVVGGRGAEPYCEDTWTRMELGGVGFSSAGGCPRCGMICMDPFTGRREGPEPLLTLAGYRRRRGAGGGGGKICFGVLFNQAAPAETAAGEGAAGVAEPSAGRASREGEVQAQLGWVARQYRQYIAIGMAVHTK